MLCKCGGASYVVNTRQTQEGTRRQRRCATCKESFHTLETLVVTVKPAAKIEPKPMAKKAADIHRKRVEVRRKNEDVKNYKDRVPSYYIEDEEDY